MEMSIHRNLFFALLTLMSVGCTNCEQEVINTDASGVWIAEVRHRVCGSFSGYAVAVYRVNENPPGEGDGDKEPFQATYKTSDFEMGDLPIETEWINDQHLIIHHDTRMNVEDRKSKPMVIKADTAYEELRIQYDPEPVIWTQK